MKQKLLTFLLAICLIPCAFAAVACDNTPPPEPDTTSKLVVIQINNPTTTPASANLLSTSLLDEAESSINSPAVEIIINANNKVESITALNEEGYDLISKTSSLSILTQNVADAAKALTQAANSNGYIGENVQISISISGSAAQTIYNQIKTKISETVDASKIQTLVSLNQENLRDKVEECYPELSDTAINALSDQQLIEKLKESHTTTQDLNNQALKEMYLAVRERVYGLARLAVSNPSGFQTNITTLQTTFTTFADTWLTESDDNTYLPALEAYLGSKSAENLASLETALNDMKTALNTALATIDTLIEDVDKNIELSSTTILSIDTTMNYFLTMLTGNSAG